MGSRGASAASFPPLAFFKQGFGQGDGGGRGKGVPASGHVQSARAASTEGRWAREDRPPGCPVAASASAESVPDWTVTAAAWLPRRAARDLPGAIGARGGRRYFLIPGQERHAGAFAGWGRAGSSRAVRTEWPGSKSRVRLVSLLEPGAGRSRFPSGAF